MFTFSDINELRNAQCNQSVAVQTGSASGLWTRCADSGLEDNGGYLIQDKAGYWWERSCDRSRIEARWFGVKADGQTDDAPALQMAIDAIPETGGMLLLPTGHMRCFNSLKISRSYISIEGANCGLLSKHFEPDLSIGKGSLLLFDEGNDGIVIQGPDENDGIKKARLGGITLRNFGIAGAGRQAKQTAIVSRLAEGKRWGTTDGLLLERLYVIDCQWSAKLHNSDAGIINQCWFSECGNGLHLDSCIYTSVIAPCFADNDGIGLLIQGGNGNEIHSAITVRNKIGLLAEGTHLLRINGGVFKSDGSGGPRQDLALIQLKGDTTATVTGASFSVKKQKIFNAIERSNEATLIHEGCQAEGDLKQLVSVF